MRKCTRRLLARGHLHPTITRVNAMGVGPGRIRLHLRAERALGLSALTRTHAPVSVSRHVKHESAASIPSGPTQQYDENAPSGSAVPAPSAPAVSSVDTGPFTSALLDRAERLAALDELDASHVRPCMKCGLCKTRTNTVFGMGDVEADLFIVGNGPGDEEDRAALPFQGEHGRKLDEMLGAMSLSRQQIYVADLVKCRLPDDRSATVREVRECQAYLVRQIEIVRPRVLLALGLQAARFLVGSRASMSELRGKWSEFRGIRVMVTHPPSVLIRKPPQDVRRAVWEDLQQVMAALGLKAAKKEGRTA